ncbi:glycolate oxidase FAD binding subunit [Rubrivivax sp. A210]|uniref:glycolate oxidase subunit GlcE n=1 Tax=Rubrivivax sp. A210 TaxID=2772301 RepID=UPI001918832D|nr:glycolate oxidase subunit GlcE [Rubrivivax sp. A210]CAD5370315.1 glycolate oxidase FAD binding subunit [Rubrivivax sp. A210]
MDSKAAALQGLVERVREAAAHKTPLEIRGGGTKAFYGGEPRGEPLSTATLAGISSYEPSELVVSVLAGTPLAALETLLAAQGQCLAFEPPRYAPGGTVGGMVAAGLAGPARAAVGGVRDYVLGATLLNGRGELLNFGGTVMKNVAGYDVSRALAGTMGILGLICEVSLKVLPRPAATATLRLELDAAQAMRRLGEWRGQPLPLNASAWWDGALVLRLSGAAAAVSAAQQKMGGEPIPSAMADAFWTGLRDHGDEFFVGAARAVQGGATLWRLSVPATAAPLRLSGEQLIEWGGAQRWICTTAPAATLREAAAAAGGHAVMFRGAERAQGIFAPLKPPLDRIHRELKKAFDPEAIFNPGRLLPDL